jgi:hypothetical protein
MIGMACVIDDFPLYFEAMNEKGLSIAGLNFPEMRSIMILQRKNITSLLLNSFRGSWHNARV